MSEICEHCGWPLIEDEINHKYKEIKQMAWEFCLSGDTARKADIIIAWKLAEQFYNYAKEKEEGANENDI